jgi:hypothetical protein
MRRSSFALALTVVAGATSLGGCAKPGIATGTNPILVTNQGSEAAVSRTVAVAPGSKLKLQFVIALNPDCTVIQSASARVVKEPVHGRITIQPGEDFAYFPPANPRSSCNSRRVKGQIVEYHAPVGFKGTDIVKYDYFNSVGGVFHNTVTINVL